MDYANYSATYLISLAVKDYLKTFVMETHASLDEMGISGQDEDVGIKFPPSTI